MALYDTFPASGLAVLALRGDLERQPETFLLVFVWNDSNIRIKEYAESVDEELEDLAPFYANDVQSIAFPDVEDPILVKSVS